MNSDRTETACATSHPVEIDRLASALVEWHDELARITGELQSSYERFCQQTRSDFQALIEENERLRRLVVEKERDGPLDEGRLPDVVAELEKLAAENRRLQDRLQQKEELLAELQQNTQRSNDIDLESYEAELNRFRQQLEADRRKLNAELNQVRLRNEELDEATREMEMEFSRERADLARERTRLERLREEVRAELERVQRDIPMRESMMSVHRLRESLTQQQR